MVEHGGLKIAVACPSYRRPHCRTAHYIPETRIYVDPSEAQAYKAENGPWGEVVACAPGVQGNLPRVRNYILDKEFGAGADVVVMMDDDVSSMAAFVPDPETGFGYVRRGLDRDAFFDFVVYGSRLCLDWGFGMWGVNYNQDKKLYHHFEPFSTTKGAMGQFMAFVKDELRFDESLPLKEDYDMSLQQCNKYRGSLCINFVHVNGDFGKLAGGTAVRRNYDAEFEQFKRFKAKWGSGIVRGAAKAKPTSKPIEGQKFRDTYDFSHPVVRIPIEGV